MYRGRFAPSPTGPLHFGSLVAAVASYLDARAAGGEWLVRMEDLDTPRNVPGAADDILLTVERFGFEWDGLVMYQSNRIEAYHFALDELKRKNAVYPCTCSRREICACRDGIGDSARQLREALRFLNQPEGCVSRCSTGTDEIAASLGNRSLDVRGSAGGVTVVR